MGQEPRQQSRRKLEVFVSGLGGIRAFISPLAGLFVALGHTLPPSDGQALGQLDFDLRQEHPFLCTTLEIRRALVTVCPRIVSCTSLLSLLDRVDTFPRLLLALRISLVPIQETRRSTTSIREEWIERSFLFFLDEYCRFEEWIDFWFRVEFIIGESIGK